MGAVAGTLKGPPPTLLPIQVDRRCESFTSDPPGHSTQHSTPALLRLIAQWDGSSLPEMGQVLKSTFEALDYRDHIKNFEGLGIDPQLCINNLDRVSSRSAPA